MTPDEFRERMKYISENEFNTEDKYIQIEDKHIQADNLMCEVLSELGYSEGVEIFENMYKWYS